MFRQRTPGIAVIAVVAVGLGLSVGSCHGGSTAYVLVDAPRPGADAVPAVLSAGVSDSVINARFRNVHFHMWPGVALTLDDLVGKMHSTRADRVVSFDDKTSFVLAIDSGTVELEVTDMARLMNTYVFAYKGAPLKELSFETDGNHLVQRGTVHKVVDIPFEMVAEVSATPAGEIRVHPISMKICSIPGKGLMDALGITLAKLLDLRQAKGVRADGDDLLLDVTKLLPPPAIAGHLASVHVAPGRLVQLFAPASSAVHPMVLEPDSGVSNYMLFRGGTLQFGKLFMVHADMEVVDMSPADPFDFDISHYHEQLVAGYHRTKPDDGLLVYMPDLSKLSGDAALVIRK